MTLHPDNAAAVSAARPADVIKSLASASSHLKSGRWLGKGNRYVSDTIQRLSDDIASNKINSRHLAQYIGVSSVLHLTDGWGYLGRAIQSLMQGDPHRALHLAYYAELRATMSLLATQGIGVFNNKHFIIDGSNQATALPKKSPTHEFAWDALNHWAQSAGSGLAFAGILRPYGRTLEDWLQPVGGGAAVLPQAQEWLKQWGMDLSFIGKDRESRNGRSYRPSGLPTPWRVNAESAARFGVELWEMMEPGVSTFETLDRHVLRLSVESLFRGREAIEPHAQNARFVDFVESVVSNQSMTGLLGEKWTNFLLRRSEPIDPIVIQNSKKLPQDLESDPYGVISRSALLLRVANGSTNQAFEDAAVPADKIEFWRSELGLSRGFWNVGGKPQTMTDLWLDVTEAVDELVPFYNELPESDRTLRNLAQQFGSYIIPFGGFERIALWGIVAP